MPKSETMRTSIEKDIADLDADVLKLMEISEKICDGDVEDILKFNSEYMTIVEKHEKTTAKLLTFDKERTTELWDKTDSIYDDLNYIFDITSIPINNIIAKKTMEMEESYKKSQGIQLAVFSIVLTILAFVLTNAKILSVDGISVKNVLLVNLSFILSADVFFSFIYLFLGPVFYSKKGRLRFFTFIFLPIILIAGIVLVSLFMN